MATIEFYLGNNTIGILEGLNRNTPLADIANSIKTYLDTTPDRMLTFKCMFRSSYLEPTPLGPLIYTRTQLAPTLPIDFVRPQVPIQTNPTYRLRHETPSVIVQVPGDLCVNEYRQFTLNDLDTLIRSEFEKLNTREYRLIPLQTIKVFIEKTEPTGLGKYM